jgi:hypothetical protein
LRRGRVFSHVALPFWLEAVVRSPVHGQVRGRLTRPVGRVRAPCWAVVKRRMLSGCPDDLSAVSACGTTETRACLA